MLQDTPHNRVKVTIFSLHLVSIALLSKLSCSLNSAVVGHDKVVRFSPTNPVADEVPLGPDPAIDVWRVQEVRDFRVGCYCVRGYECSIDAARCKHRFDLLARHDDGFPDPRADS